ncbi:hypothetical protein K438DRAFT_522502 [Mycena galopus ATCC 62051]|nr:hypothetical protein K438DRAFT_522502 [Mycena galopus ATCC 62051]
MGVTRPVWLLIAPQVPVGYYNARGLAQPHLFLNLNFHLLLAAQCLALVAPSFRILFATQFSGCPLGHLAKKLLLLRCRGASSWQPSLLVSVIPSPSRTVIRSQFYYSTAAPPPCCTSNFVSPAATIRPRWP